MSNWKLVKLDFGNTPAHFGEVGIGLEETSERVRSDTLFSAWVISYARLGGDIEALLDRFQSEKEPPFRLSSTFIYQQQNGQDIYYLPRPKKLPINYPTDDLTIAKTCKKIEFLPLDIWEKWYQTDLGFSISDLDKLKNRKGEENYKDAFKIETQPKVAIDRLTRATNFYHTSFVHYRSEAHHKSGLYFLIQFNDLSLENDLRAALELLGDEGIGGERSSGAGRFIPSWHERPKIWQHVIDFSQGDYYSLISLYWDDKENLVPLDNSSYELQERGGWIASPFSGKQQRRKTVRMFTEGSTFTEKLEGKLAVVTPDRADHPVYRSGIALSIPIKTLQEKPL